MTIGKQGQTSPADQVITTHAW